MQLRPISEQEMSRWGELRSRVYPELDEEYDTREMEMILHSNHWFCFFVVEGAEQIIGLVELSLRNIVDNCLTSPVAYLEGLYLEEAWRGRGLGREVIQSIFAWCRERGLSELATDAELDNEAAQAFYRALGFEETDRVVEFKIEVE